MYGSEKTDLVVKYYDEAFGVTSQSEAEWYLSKAREFGGPVLDLACGTGRMALLLAREGFEVTGVDSSQGMLNQLRNKLAAAGREIRQRVHLERQGMSELALDDRFNMIICCDAFYHNLTVQEEMACLDCVARHLLPNGRIVFNLTNPTCEFLLKTAGSRAEEFEERGTYTLSDSSDVLLVEQAHAGNMLDQTVKTTLRITRTDVEGNVVEKGESTWTARYLFRYEAIHLLYRCGFEVEALVGHYRSGPVALGSQLIFQAKR
jgi:2-polyprenyl-3-methyl-5-hydroxy-6-metoxy-1,4-benzoquinol methylase